jgi:predicted acyl esterase
MLPIAVAQPRPAADPQVIAARNANEKELESLAVIERKVMVPMRDGKRMAAATGRERSHT